MASESISQQHFNFYLICISIIAIFDACNYILQLQPGKNKSDNKGSESDKPKNESKESKYKRSLKFIYLAKLIPNILAILIYYFFPSSHYSSLLPSSLSAISGILTFIAGFLIRQITLIQLGYFYRNKTSGSDEHQIIDKGFYAFMRHPVYTGTFLELTGAALLYNHYHLSWFLSLPYLVAVLDRIQYEEYELVQEFGEKYREYMKRAGMLFPKRNFDI